MNCILLLLLLSCCGGNGNACSRGNSYNNGYGCDDSYDRDRRDSGRSDSDRSTDDCGCENERYSRTDSDDDYQQREREGYDNSGMIPPPWHDYSGYSRKE